jgi:RHH-type proline utilization regulon transcriptional repressor/proline dehydrogenase/delta 1-pyrroline-5-carboxylate dehydrogenase
MFAEPPSALEALTQAHGRDFFARLDRSGPPLFTPGWLDDQILGWSMADEAIKVQLFRFIDALPLLKSPESIARHLREYLSLVPDRLPVGMGWLLRRLPERGAMGRLFAWLANVNARRMARRFIAGSNVQEALAAVETLRRRVMAFTIDLLGEAVITESESDHYQKQYLELVEGLAEPARRWPVIDQIDRDHLGTLPRVNVSVKLSSLYSQFDPIDPEGTSHAVLRRLKPILRLARQTRAFVNFDMEQYSYKDLTLHIFRRVVLDPEFRDWPDIGIAIQAYLHDGLKDLHELLDVVRRRGTPVWVRLVKGAYWDYENAIASQMDWPIPVFTRKWQSDANFEEMTRILMQNYQNLRPAFGSHNVRSIAHALACADYYNVPPNAFEFQMLYGMADPLKRVIVDLGHRLRVYTPYGQLLPGMAYLVRRLLENTSNDSFLRASFTELRPEDELLMNPRLAADRLHRGAEARRTSTEASQDFRNEPPTDFSREESRSAMASALRRVMGQFSQRYPLVIDGRSVETGEWMESIDPSQRRRSVGQFALARIADAEQAVAAAKRVFPLWRDTPAKERAELLFRAAQVMRRRRFELAAWEVYECAKPWREADADVAEAIDFCEYYAREMLRLSQPRRRDVLGEENEYFYEPRGVAVVIAPWNFPLAILCGMTSAALVSGNPVIMKPAEQSSIVGAQLMDVYREAGVPTAVLQYLPGRGEEIGPTLVGHPDVALIAFTGSRGVGLSINRLAAETPPGQDHVKRVIAEMGGKNAIIIDADADLDEAVKGVVESAFQYAGQKCSACSRVIVLESIADAFVPRLIEATRSLKIAPAEDPSCFVPPVIDGEAQARIVRLIEQGKKEAKLLFAAELGALADEGFFVPPTIFGDVPPSAVIAQEEIFGPVLAVLRVRNLDEALEVANGTSYALTGGLFSRSPAHIAEVRRRFRVGNLYINRKITGALVDRQPFGGFKLSGIGSKAGGPDYLQQFLLPRAICENTMRHGFVPSPPSIH